MMGAHGVACDGGGKEFWGQGLAGLERAPGREALGSGDAEAGGHARGRNAALGWRSPTQSCPAPGQSQIVGGERPRGKPRAIPLHGEGATGVSTASRFGWSPATDQSTAW